MSKPFLDLALESATKEICELLGTDEEDIAPLNKIYRRHLLEHLGNAMCVPGDDAPIQAAWGRISGSNSGEIK